MANKFHKQSSKAEESLCDLTDNYERIQIYKLKRSEGEGKGKRSRQLNETESKERILPLSTSRLTQDWLAEAKRIVPPLQLDNRHAISRSARRNRSTEGISDEILRRSLARHNRSRSDFYFAADSSYPPPSSLLPPLSPPRNLHKSFRRKTVSSYSCSIDNDSTPRRFLSGGRKMAVEMKREEDVNEINAFLRRQRAMVDMACDGEVSVKAKFVLSSYAPDTSSMVAAICYAWLLENMREREMSCIKDEVVVPVINMRRARMWEHKQAAWLFHYIGIDASALIFSDELDLESLLMGKQLSLFIVGQDVLKTNDEDGSLCTILTDKYCEDAYDLLQAPHIRKLLLAGILLDTQNLSSAAKTSTIRDSEAVQLLLVGSSPDYGDFFFHQVIKEHGEESFIESMRRHYGKLSIRMKQKHSTAPAVGRIAVQQTQTLPLVPFSAMEKSSRIKNKFTLGRFFSFSS